MSTTRDWVGEKQRVQVKVGQALQKSVAGPLSPEEPIRPGGWSPPVDIYETDDRIVLRADLPGISIEQIELKIENEQLILKGERSQDSSARREDFHRIERPYGRFRRSFALPRSIRQAEIRAVLNHGVLEVVLPKHAQARSRPIKVEVR
ncbi:MAG: Hsp20/alpha crystallin family protein [Acidobacteria bacterium]|nr:Hsp20/alpha crystallin family protein [Acidobacteriota bacterium]MCI0657765.1 Hsp20/alpha crystallin family protein [Acidobacteriota bacterium]